jgi:hypothetical protein
MRNEITERRLNGSSGKAADIFLLYFTALSLAGLHSIERLNGNGSEGTGRDRTATLSAFTLRH